MNWGAMAAKPMVASASYGSGAKELTTRLEGVSDAPASTFGPNAWLVDEMHERYRADPESVSESWREFFSDYIAPTEQSAPFRVAVPTAEVANATRNREEAAAPSPAPARKPGIGRHGPGGPGLAGDLEKADGQPPLPGAVHKGAGPPDFRAFYAAFGGPLRKVKSNKIAPDDFAGVTVSLTNPGTIGT